MTLNGEQKDAKTAETLQLGLQGPRGLGSASGRPNAQRDGKPLLGSSDGDYAVEKTGFGRIA